MNNIDYAFTSKQICLDGELFAVFGISVFVDNKIMHIFDDITTNKLQIEKLLSHLRHNEISPVHFYDIVEDFLSE